MRVVPILTAGIVLAASYVFVMERDRLDAGLDALNEWAGAQATETETEHAPEPVAAEETAIEQDQLFAVVTQQIVEQDLESGVVLRGRTQAARQVEVRAETSGLVISEPRARGSLVAQGDVLCELAPGTRAASLAEAEARLAEAQINFTTAERLSEGGYAAQTRVTSAEAGMRSAQAGVEAARAELDRLVITAPFGGVLEADSAQTGSLLSPGGLCATVIGLDPILLVGHAAEAQIGRLTEGAMAGARLSSGQELVGQVSFLARSGDPATRTFRVEITVPNPDLAVRDGLSADILVAASASRGHLVPGSALTLNDEGQVGLRLVDDANHTFFVPVTVLRDAADGFWVSGLPTEANVIVVGQEYVTDGIEVRVVPRVEG